MDPTLKVIHETGQQGCGSCATNTCSTCSSTTNQSPVLSRRELGKAILGASAFVMLAGCGEKKAPEQVKVAPEANPPLSPDLEVVKESKGPIMTTLEEFYKIGPGPSSSHTMGPMRITYDFFQRVTKLPEDQLKKATGLKVHLFGSLSATGKGHGTDRASLAGLLGKAPASCPPEFLDGLATNPDEVHKVTLGPTPLKD